MSTVRPSRNIKSTTLLLLGAFALLVGVRNGAAATSYWNTSGTFEDFGNSANWIGGVPGGADTAAFTNNPGGYQQIQWFANATNANAVFSSPDSDTRDLGIDATKTWLVTNSFLIASNPGLVRQLSGNLVVTNAAGNATLTVGAAATFQVYSSTATIDRLISTNGGGFIPSQFATLNVLHGATITTPSYYEIDGGSWNLLGGTNTLTQGSTQGLLLGSGHKLTVAGPSTVLSNNEIVELGWGGTDSQILVTNGAHVHFGKDLEIGVLTSADIRNKVTVTGTNSLLTTGAGYLIVGKASSSNELTIANGGTVDTLTVGNYSTIVGYFPGLALDNKVLVTGDKSLLRTYGLGVSGNGSALISNGGMVESRQLATGAAGTISNIGGVYQFYIPNPSITPGSANSIVIQDGTISFRGMNDAPVYQVGTQLTNMTFLGNNAYRLVSATNTAVASYSFQTDNAPGYASLVLDNGRFQATTVTMGPGTSLSGNGTVASDNVTNLGTIAPGFSAGSLTFTSNLVLGGSSRLEMQIGGINPAVDYDQLIVDGNVTVTGTLAVAMINSFSPTPGDTFRLIDNRGGSPIFGEFNGLTNGAFIDASGNGSDAYFTIQYDGGTGNDLVLTATVPEPSTLALLSVAACTLLLRKSNRS